MDAGCYNGGSVQRIYNMSLKIETVILEDNIDSRRVAILNHATGFERLGGGKHAEVFSSPDTPYVVKVMSGVDRGYLSYLETVSHQHRSTPYAPIVYRVIHYRFEDEFYGNMSGWKPGYTPYDKFVFYLEKLSQPTRREWATKGNRYSVDRFAKKLDYLMIDAQHGGFNWLSLKPKHQKLISVLLDAGKRAWMDDDTILFDLHAGNVMKRGKQYVVTDPLN